MPLRNTQQEGIREYDEDIQRAAQKKSQALKILSRIF